MFFLLLLLSSLSGARSENLTELMKLQKKRDGAAGEFPLMRPMVWPKYRLTFLCDQQPVTQLNVQLKQFRFADTKQIEDGKDNDLIETEQTDENGTICAELGRGPHPITGDVYFAFVHNCTQRGRDGKGEAEPKAKPAWHTMLPVAGAPIGYLTVELSRMRAGYQWVAVPKKYNGTRQSAESYAGEELRLVSLAEYEQKDQRGFYLRDRDVRPDGLWNTSDQDNNFTRSFCGTEDKEGHLLSADTGAQPKYLHHAKRELMFQPDEVMRTSEDDTSGLYFHGNKDGEYLQDLSDENGPAQGSDRQETSETESDNVQEGHGPL